ncbi:MAG: sulfotransferase domain-containing protein [Xenococcaceae cyanobacterium MO_167.B27]|nr:sulfotransferase domain-containing protein [Xenococcaceae cyanobacterium MO_167.B27]
MFNLKQIIFKKKYQKIFNNIDIYPDDIFLVSYPKSGNTWLRFLIGNYLTSNKCDFNNSHLIIPDIHFNPEDCNYIKRPRFIKSHIPFTTKYNKVIYLVRDGRDVAVSYYFYMLKYGKIHKSTKFENFLEIFNSGNLDKYTLWSDHVKSWITNSSNNFFLLTYEELKKYPISSLANVLSFSEIAFDYKRILSAVNASSFDAMKKIEQKQHDQVSLFANSDPNIQFVRNGEIGEWKKFFTTESVENFINIHGDALKMLSYI